MARELLPNSTPVPDVILDFWLSELSGAELKVVLYIARRTYGFGKQSDDISLTQICSGIKKRDGTVLDTGTGLSRSSVARALKTLDLRSIILRKVNISVTTREHEESTYSLNLNWQSDQGSGDARNVIPKSNYPISKLNSGCSKNATTRSSKVKPLVVLKSNPQETDQETVLQETAASKPDAAATLVRDLITQNLNRADAMRLVRMSPDECRRQLDFLAFLIKTGFKFRSGKGAYLRKAIEDGYAQPAGYAEAIRAQAHRANLLAREEAQTAQSDAKKRWLRETLDCLEKERPDAFTGFTAYVEMMKQAAISKPILNNAPAVKERLLKSFDNEDNRVALLEEYLLQDSDDAEKLQEFSEPCDPFADE